MAGIGFSTRVASHPGLALPGAGRFGDDELRGLPVPVQRYFRASVPIGAPLLQAAHLEMRGQLKLGARWLPFRARELLAPHAGFVWAARVAGVISGSDRYVDGRGALDWRLFGLVPVVHAEGPDVARSAAARGAAEAVWLPTALLPRFGVAWSAHDDRHVVARLHVDEVDVAIECRIDGAGRLEAAAFDRWGDPGGTGSWAMHRFGIDVTGHRSLGGYTVPAAGRVGWFPGTDRWGDGEFFRYELTRLHPVRAPR